LPRPFVVAVAALLGLTVAGAASAHVAVTPPFLAAESTETVDLSVPNERNESMTGFSLTVPSGFEIVHAHPAEGWAATSDSTTATWTGGSLAPREVAAFGLHLTTPATPGVVEFLARQRYDDGAVVRWPVSFTVTPADESPSQNLALAAVVGVIGVLVVIAVVTLAWRRRSVRRSSE
jgi:uncharacterized protein YcnI